jgi:SRSO17 transposase
VEELVRVPGARWRVEEAVKLAKSAAGMADYEVRSFHGWYRAHHPGAAGRSPASTR